MAQFSNSPLSRRDVGRAAAGLAVSAIGLSACDSKPASVAGAALSPSAPVDYVVVGSGAGGGPLAANLAKAGYKVVLIEAGGGGDPRDFSDTRVPSAGKRGSCAFLGLLRTALHGRRPANPGQQVRPRQTRHLLPARRHARWMHSPPRHDHHPGRQRRLGRNRSTHRRSLLAQRGDERLLPTPGALRVSASTAD